MTGHEFKPYVDNPDYCVAELADSGDTCNRPREEHAKLAPEGTHLRYVQDLVARAYAAMGAAGSNDEEHDVLYELVAHAENDIRSMGDDLPPHSGDEDYF